MATPHNLHRTVDTWFTCERISASKVNTKCVSTQGGLVFWSVC